MGPTTIHVGAAAETIPDALLDQLARGGRMIIPVGGVNARPGPRVQVDRDASGTLCLPTLSACATWSWWTSAGRWRKVLFCEFSCRRVDGGEARHTSPYGGSSITRTASGARASSRRAPRWIDSRCRS